MTKIGTRRLIIHSQLDVQFDISAFQEVNAVLQPEDVVVETWLQVKSDIFKTLKYRSRVEEGAQATTQTTGPGNVAARRVFPHELPCPGG